MQETYVKNLKHITIDIVGNKVHLLPRSSRHLGICRVASWCTKRNMSPSKPTRNIRVHVPRHNSQRLGPAGTVHVEILARKRRLRVDVRQTAYEPTSAIALAIVRSPVFFCCLDAHRSLGVSGKRIGVELATYDCTS